MNLDLVITQIKTVAAFAGNVAGAAAYAHGVEDQVWLPLPAAYVVPLDEDAEPNDDLGAALFQHVRERFQVIVVFDNSVDRRGQTVTSLYEPLKYALLAAVLSWRPNSSVDNVASVQPTDIAANRSARGLYYGGGALMSFDRARLMYAWTFCLDTAISDADGWQPVGDPLSDIAIVVPFFQDDPTATATAVVDVPLPQN